MMPARPVSQVQLDDGTELPVRIFHGGPYIRSGPVSDGLGEVTQTDLSCRVESEEKEGEYDNRFFHHLYILRDAQFLTKIFFCCKKSSVPEYR